MNIEIALKNNRLTKSLTGMSIREFEILSIVFEQVLYEHFANKKRERIVGGGRKGALINAKEKLFFILFYLKVYPTFDLAGFVFGADRSRPFEWVKQFLPILEKALGRSIEMPKRKISTLEEFYEICPEAKDLFIDGTERRTQRPQKGKNQRKRYSGKKKTYTRKNMIISDDNRKILFISPSKEGKTHDFTQLKKNQILEHIPKEVNLWVDKGYQGIKKAIKNDNKVYMPHKKTRGKELTSEQKADNSVISGLRIVVEHAINGIKRFGSMSNTYRNKKGQDDQMIYACSALWNFHLQYGNC
jgi:hypothetical protein